MGRTKLESCVVDTSFRVFRWPQRLLLLWIFNYFAICVGSTTIDLPLNTWPKNFIQNKDLGETFPSDQYSHNNARLRRKIAEIGEVSTISRSADRPVLFGFRIDTKDAVVQVE